MADDIKSVTLGYCEDGYRCHEVKERMRGGMALLWGCLAETSHAAAHRSFHRCPDILFIEYPQS